MIFDISAYVGSLSYAQAERGLWHLWPLKVTTPIELVGLINRFGISKAAIRSLRSIYYDHSEGNKEVFEAVREYPNRFVAVVTVYPHYQRSLEEFEEYVNESGIAGLELEPLYHDYELNDETIDPFLEISIKRKIPVLLPLCITMNQNFPKLKVEDVQKLVDRYPDITYVLGKFSYEIEKVLHLMKKHDSVLVETSGLHLFGGIERLVEEVGADRVLYGSGLPIQMIGPALAKIQEAEIREEEKNLILGENAQKLFAK
jgi:predicted TIM-barrel fold metal-dependent hydrolase